MEFGILPLGTGQYRLVPLRRTRWRWHYPLLLPVCPGFLDFSAQAYCLFLLVLPLRFSLRFLGGFGPGLLVGVVWGIIGWWVFRPPHTSPIPLATPEALSLLTYFLGMLLVVWGADQHLRLAQRLENEEHLCKLACFAALPLEFHPGVFLLPLAVNECAGTSGCTQSRTGDGLFVEYLIDQFLGLDPPDDGFTNVSVPTRRSLFYRRAIRRVISNYCTDTLRPSPIAHNKSVRIVRLQRGAICRGLPGAVGSALLGPRYRELF